MNKKIITHSKKQTINFGKRFAKKIFIKNRCVLGLIGELGAGKTQFVKGLAEGFGIKENITSPTFVLIKNYQAEITNCKLKNLIHIDCYRLSSPEELLDLGFNEFVKQENNVIVIEWADKVKKLLPKYTIFLNFAVTGGNNRRIEIINFEYGIL